MPIETELSSEMSPEDIVKEILEKEFRSRMLYELSTNLPENSYLMQVTDEESRKEYKIRMNEYEKQVKEYSTSDEDIKVYNEQNPSSKKTDFIESDNANIGWKFHLNLEPKFVKEVSEYLITNGYLHKFLMGGEVESGKVFTVYVGDYKLAEQLSKKISNDLKQYLCRPYVLVNEREFAPGVVGRFVGSNKEFWSYGTVGFSWLKKDIEIMINSHVGHYTNEEKEKLFTEAEEQAYRELKRIYGDYFFNESIQ